MSMSNTLMQRLRENKPCEQFLVSGASKKDLNSLIEAVYGNVYAISPVNVKDIYPLASLFGMDLMAKVCIYIDPKVQKSKLAPRKLIPMSKEMLEKKKEKSLSTPDTNGLPEIRRRESRGKEKSYRELGSDQSEEEEGEEEEETETIPTKRRNRKRKNSSDVDGDISKILSTLDEDGMEEAGDSDFAAEMDDNFDDIHSEDDKDDIKDVPPTSGNKKGKNKTPKPEVKSKAIRDPSPAKAAPPKKAKRDETVYECGKCKLIFISLEKCNAHMKDVHGVPMVSVNETFICTHSGCNFECSDADTLKYHTNTVHSPVSAPPTPKSPAKSPIRTPVSSSQYKCGICSAEFETSDSLGDHVMSIHARPTSMTEPAKDR